MLKTAGDYTMGSKSDGPSPTRSYMQMASGGSIEMGNFFALNDLGQVMSTLPFGGASSTAYSINASGDILGGYTDAAGLRHRVLYSNGVVTDITAIIGTPFSPSSNDLGQILFDKDAVMMIYIDGEAYPIQMVDFDPERPDFYMISDLNDEGQLPAMTCPPDSSDLCDVVRLDFVSVVPETPA